jgi:cell division protease FtsH
MSQELGMVEYGDSDEPLFLAREIHRARHYSEATAQMIDSEVKRLIDEAYQKAKQMLTEHRVHLEEVAKALLEFETLDGDHIREIIRHGSLLNPPASPKPPELPRGEKVEPRGGKRGEAGPEGELPGLAGAPA